MSPIPGVPGESLAKYCDRTVTLSGGQHNGYTLRCRAQDRIETKCTRLGTDVVEMQKAFVTEKEALT